MTVEKIVSNTDNNHSLEMNIKIYYTVKPDHTVEIRSWYIEDTHDYTAAEAQQRRMAHRKNRVAERLKKSSSPRAYESGG